MSDEDWIGRLIDGRYIVDGVLGSGGMGMVFRARHKFTAGTLAIKVLKPELASDPEIQHRFLAEARAANTIGHPNIVQVIDAGRSPEGMLYLAMELLVGRPLREPIQRGELRPVDMRTIVSELLDALTAAHDRGFIHRDLKPENVFLVTTPHGPSVKLLDFGIAKVIDTQNVASVRTATGSMLGTPAYMSPEQIENPSTVDARTDLWAVGVMVFEMLTGRLPFPGATIGEIMVSVVTQEPRSIRKYLPTAAPELEDFFARALARDPAARFGSAHEMRAALAGVLALRPVHAVPIKATQSGGMVGHGAHTPAPAVPAGAQMTQATGYGAQATQATGVNAGALATQPTGYGPGGPQMPASAAGPASSAHANQAASSPAMGHVPTPGYATPPSGVAHVAAGPAPHASSPGYVPSPGYATPPSGVPQTPGIGTPALANPAYHTGGTPPYQTGGTPPYQPSGIHASTAAIPARSKTPLVIAIVGTVGIVAIVLAIVLTRTRHTTPAGPGSNVVAANPPANTPTAPTTTPPTAPPNGSAAPPNTKTAPPSTPTAPSSAPPTTNSAPPPTGTTTTPPSTPRTPRPTVGSNGPSTRPEDPYAGTSPTTTRPQAPTQATTTGTTGSGTPSTPSTPNGSGAPGSTPTTPTESGVSLDEHCTATCVAARTCGLAMRTCIADCKANPAVRACTELALANKCREAAMCGFRAMCGNVQLGNGTCKAAMTCQGSFCAPNDFACGCKCATNIASRHVPALMLVDVCAINCNYDQTCIQQRCMLALQTCAGQ